MTPSYLFAMCRVGVTLDCEDIQSLTFSVETVFSYLLDLM